MTRDITLIEYRRKIRELGYKVRTKKYSEFIACFYFKDDKQIPTNVMTREDWEKHRGLHGLRADFKTRVYDGYYKVVV